MLFNAQEDVMSRFKYLFGVLTIFTLTASGVHASSIRSPESLISGSENKATGSLLDISSEVGDMLDDPVPPAPNESTCLGDLGEVCDPPSVVLTRPVRDNVPIDVPAYWIAVEFDQPMLEGTINGVTFTLESQQGARIPGTVLVEGRTATFIPAETLD